MKISFHGAARTVTGSKHLLHINDPEKKILLDCGMFQGMGKETLELNSEFGFDPAEIDHVIISHAHIDHIGLLPKLVKEGYEGNIYCTFASRELIEMLLIDSAFIQEADIKHINKIRDRQGREHVQPLYEQEDVVEVFTRLVTVQYNETYIVDDGIELLYTDCGHILGSAAVNLKIKEGDKEYRLTFSGDIGRYRDVLLRSPDKFPQADYIIMESTYGDKLHDLISPAADDLLHYVEETCIQKKGKLIIPAFSLGRTQELLYMLNMLELERRLPKVKYYVDSPLSIKVTKAIKQHPECFNDRVKDLLKKDDDVFLFKGLEFIKDVQDSKNLNYSDEPCVIISASGMAEAGRVKHHIANNIGDEKNTILMVGYCEPNSLGGRLKRAPKDVTIFGIQHSVKADIGVIDSMSAHADYEDLSQWLACQDPKQVKKLFLVHGEYEVQVKFRNRLLRKGFHDVEIPALHQEIGLG
ncbi:MAG: MBL fold metallo-hydrolase [Chitinophagales bacterium]|nr:MBL fold metallo-hydrolase [Chitinophagaceae bacterium]MCB9066047.1 MBL fold metallo-hydrolase [Chitinophagales bacterium]